MSRYPRLSITLAAAVLSAVLPGSAAHAADGPTAERQPHVSRATSLVGTELRLTNGTAVPVPRAAGRYPVLLGTVRDGWVVAAGSYYSLVRPDGTVRRIADRGLADPEFNEVLSDDGLRIISSAIDQGDTLRIRVLDLQGRDRLDSFYVSGPGDVLDAHGPLGYLGDYRGLRVLDERTGKPTRLLDAPTSMVDVSQDTVFIGTTRNPYIVGPTSLTEPGEPAWRAAFDPVALSADGRYVVSRSGVVRAMADGAVVRRVPAEQPGAEQLFIGWGTRHEVLVERKAGRQRLLVSCPVPEGDCHRVGSTSLLVSLPTSHSGPYRHY
jgi:hypothetical protein